MGNLVTNRIRVEINGSAEETIRGLLPFLTTEPADDILSRIAACGRAEPVMDPLLALPIPEVLRAVPEKLPDNIDLALAASTKFDFVIARARLHDPLIDRVPDFMRPPNRRQVIEQNRHARKTDEELRAWAEENIPESMKIAHLMKIAYRDTLHMEVTTWFPAVMGSRSFAETLSIETDNDVILIGFDTVNAAPFGWFEALAGAVPDAAFTTWSWDEDTDYSLMGEASGDGDFESYENFEANDVRRAMAGARGLMDDDELDRDEVTDWDIEDGPEI